MKKALLIASALVITFGFSSCKTDFTCVCTNNTTGETYEPPITGVTRPVASTTCKASEFSDETCALK